MLSCNLMRPMNCQPRANFTLYTFQFLPQVVTVKEDSPAWRADIRPNDFISRINGQIVFNLGKSL